MYLFTVPQEDSLDSFSNVVHYDSALIDTTTGRKPNTQQVSESSHFACKYSTTVLRFHMHMWCMFSYVYWQNLARLYVYEYTFSCNIHVWWLAYLIFTSIQMYVACTELNSDWYFFFDWIVYSDKKCLPSEDVNYQCMTVFCPLNKQAHTEIIYVFPTYMLMCRHA